MLSRFFEPGIELGLAQAAVAALLALGVIGLARQQRIFLGRETALALVRGFVQVLLVGAVLVVLLREPTWVAVLVLLGMIAAAATIAARRGRGLPSAFFISLQGIGFGAGTVIALMTVLGVIDPEPTSLIPVGSMIIANAMVTGALVLDRFRGEVEAHVGHIEAALALGASPHVAVGPYVQAAVLAGLIPRLDSLRSLGVVWIPGLMAGMILAGADPVYAAVYQFAVLTMIYAAAGLTAVASGLLARSRIFTPAEQLVLRPSPSSRER